MSQNIKKYTTGFTIGALLSREAQLLVSEVESAEHFYQGKEGFNHEKLLNNAESTRKKIKNELERRFRALNDYKFIELFLNQDQINKNLILFYAACRLYPLIADFMLEVVLHKWRNIDLELEVDDFQNFLYKKMSHHEELSEITEKTRVKLSQVALKMITQLGILHKNKLTKRQFDPTVLRAVLNNGDQWFLKTLFMNDNDINQLLD